MSDASALGSRQEAVQPSLWDRLIDDLPGIAAETDALRRDLKRALEATSDETDVALAIDQLLEAGPRGIERRSDLDEETRRLALKLWRSDLRRRHLEERGIVVTQDVLREAVRRDIEMLFNVERFSSHMILTDTEAATRETPAELLEAYPQVRSSVVNFGVPSFSGRLSSSFDKDTLAREVRDVLHDFEPRLKRGTVKVNVRISDKTGMRIEIDGMLMLSPVPERLHLSTTIDLDNGQASTTLGDD